MNDTPLDKDLAQKDLKQILAAIKQAGHRNAFKHKKGYIIVKKGTLVKVRIFLDEYEQPIVSIMPLSTQEIIFNVILLIVFLLIGGFFFVLMFGYIVISGISFLLSLPKSRALKAEMEAIIR